MSIKNLRYRLPQFLLIVSSICLLFTVSGCVVKDIGQTVEQTVAGDYYLKSEKFDQGREKFSREVRENPYSHLANYYYGRFLLQSGENKLALEHLKKARDIVLDNPDYFFWTGVAFAENNQTTKEAENYEKALDIDPNHLQSLIYLGHNRLNRQDYKSALSLYSRALEICPTSPGALYNHALILNKLGRTEEERIGWLAYLDNYPSGSLAQKAAEHLNSIGDFSYRNHRLGARTATTRKIAFTPFKASLDKSSDESLILIGSIFKCKQQGKLQVLVFQRNNEKLAKDRAHAIKDFLVEEFPEIQAKNIGISWFGEPQKEKIRGKNFVIGESVSFFISDI